jgi:hypothetical protein
VPGGRVPGGRVPGLAGNCAAGGFGRSPPGRAGSCAAGGVGRSPPGRAGNCVAGGVGRSPPGRVAGNCDCPGLNQSGIEGRCPGRVPIWFWSLPRSMLGRVPAPGVVGRVPTDGRLGVEGRVPADGRLGVEGRVPAEGRLTEGRLGAEGLLTDGLLIEGERLTEGRALPPPPRPPRWANDPPATSAALKTAAVEIKAYFFIGIPPSRFPAISAERR